ncbi:hypothetical protein E2R68_13425 [Psychromonas sp. RZ22]|uniref:hypothetical protein n=1 Tax=Psychromonas algarum TaxID=2555643 RepID=UPI00106863B3|nr:hypothetical protein [Psychromonas sp. RZ22]TEW53187.1 hypothetical protein E2R68_13425 [Psychromonas sp. RZ22]
MHQLTLANNYRADLVKSQNIPLLIELTKKDINDFDKQLDNSIKTNFPFAVAQTIYDDELSNKTTNIIAIDGDSYEQGERFYLLETLLDQLTLELKDIKNIATLKEVLKAVLVKTIHFFAINRIFFCEKLINVIAISLIFDHADKVIVGEMS